MEPLELLEQAVLRLDLLCLPYLVTGSMGSIAYGEPRFTADIDIAVQPDLSSLQQLAAMFDPDNYYWDKRAVAEAVSRLTQFNIIHPASGLKIDFMIAPPNAFNTSRFSRARALPVLPDMAVKYASPEDIILKKLQYYKAGGSTKHLRDVRGILSVMGSRVDRSYIEQWVSELDVSAEWREVLAG